LRRKHLRQRCGPAARHRLASWCEAVACINNGAVVVEYHTSEGCVAGLGAEVLKRVSLAPAFQAGMRFIESLAIWLQQFAPAERETAYAFVRHALVYIGPGEMQRRVEQFYPRTVRDRLIRTVAAQRGIPTYRVGADPEACAAAERLRRQTLFMGLSDGARIDTVRHANVGLISDEQLVLATQVDKDEWVDLLDKLRSD
jgi:hypothetical protein